MLFTDKWHGCVKQHISPTAKFLFESRLGASQLSDCHVRKLVGATTNYHLIPSTFSFLIEQHLFQSNYKDLKKINFNFVVISQENIITTLEKMCLSDNFLQHNSRI